MVGVAVETARTRTIAIELPEWPGHLAGQHVDVRLTAEDGYQAQRSYSIASGPHDRHLELTVERLEDGEVSSYLVDELREGDELELRGPIGRYFVWVQERAAPVLLIAGGSGVVPFRSMLRHHAAVCSAAPVRLLYSARSLSEVIYHEELLSFRTAGEVDVHFTLTRQWPDDWPEHRGRIDRDLLAELAWPRELGPLVYVCGPSGFVETAAAGLVETGHHPSQVRTERFGPSGS